MLTVSSYGVRWLSHESSLHHSRTESHMPCLVILSLIAAYSICILICDFVFFLQSSTCAAILLNKLCMKFRRFTFTPISHDSWSYIRRYGEYTKLCAFCRCLPAGIYHLSGRCLPAPRYTNQSRYAASYHLLHEMTPGQATRARASIKINSTQHKLWLRLRKDGQRRNFKPTVCSR